MYWGCDVLVATGGLPAPLCGWRQYSSFYYHRHRSLMPVCTVPDFLFLFSRYTPAFVLLTGLICLYFLQFAISPETLMHTLTKKTGYWNSKCISINFKWTKLLSNYCLLMTLPAQDMSAQTFEIDQTFTHTFIEKRHAEPILETWRALENHVHYLQRAFIIKKWG